MHLIRRIFILLAVVCTSASHSYAHDSNTTMIDFKKGASQGYILHIRTPLFRLDEAVRRETEFGDKLVFNSDEYKRAIASYIKDNLRMTATQSDEKGGLVKSLVNVDATKLKLGSHETNIILQLEDMNADDIISLDISAQLMMQNPNQKNIIRFLDHQESRSVFLHEDNNFSATISSFD